MKDIRHSWAKALEDAGLEYFWIYNLRHTFASRMSAAGVSDLFVSQIIGYKTPGILQKYYSWFFKQRIAKPGVPFEGLYVVKNKKEICGAGRGSRTPKGRSPADFESNPFVFQTTHFLYLTKSCAQLCMATCEERFGLVRGQWSEFGQRKCYVNQALDVLQ
jgi:hypothetical protein